MKTKTAKLLVSLTLGLVIATSVMVLVKGSGAERVWTDQSNYYPGDTVLIHGSGFTSGGYAVPVIRPDGTVVKGDGSFIPGWDIVEIGTDGEFTYSYELDGIMGTYEVRVYDSAWSGDLAVEPIAMTTFYDAPAITLDQVRNGAAIAPVSPGDWVNGNVGGSNSHYIEGNSIPYRAIMADMNAVYDKDTGDTLKGQSIVVVLEYDAVNSGKHAIDYLTTYNRLDSPYPHEIVWGHDAEVINPTIDTTFEGPDPLVVPPPDSEFPIPAPSSTGSPVSGQPTTEFNTLPSAQKLMSLWGGEITDIEYVLPLADLSSTGTSPQKIAVTLTIDDPEMVLSWGGHIAEATIWGVGNSATGIEGSPYHMRVIEWYSATGNDKVTKTLGGVGNQDRSLSTDAVYTPARIIVDKITVPASSQSFDFTLTGGPSSINMPFSLTNAATPYDTGPSLAAGTYYVTETVPTGWDLTAVTKNGTAFTNGGAITLAQGDIVYVNFTDTQRGKIIVDKITDPSGSLKSFTFTPNWTDAFSLTDTAAPWDSGWLVPDNYNVLETVPEGWDLTAVTKNGAAFTNGGKIALGAGDIVYVNFTDTQRGKIIVEKQTLPDSSSQSFEFDPSWSGTNFFLTDGQQHDSGWLVPGSYSVDELVPAGWELISVTKNSVAFTDATSFNLAAGQIITLVYTDNQLLEFLKQFTDSWNPSETFPSTSTTINQIKTGPTVWWEVTYAIHNEDTEGHWYSLWDKWAGNLLVLDAPPTSFVSGGKKGGGTVTLGPCPHGISPSFDIRRSGYETYLLNHGDITELTSGGLYNDAHMTLHVGDQQEGTNPGKKGTGTGTDGNSYDIDISWQVYVPAGETAYLRIYIAPGINPGGVLQFSSWNTYVINTGPRVRVWADETYTDFLYSWTFTNQLTIIVQQDS